MSEGIEIRRTPSIANDEPYLAEGGGVRLIDIIDHYRAGEDPLTIAKDFGIRKESVVLLIHVTDVLMLPRCPVCNLPEKGWPRHEETLSKIRGLLK